ILRRGGSFHLRLILSPLRVRGLPGAGTVFLIALSQLATVAGVFAEFISPAARAETTATLTKVPYAGAAACRLCRLRCDRAAGSFSPPAGAQGRTARCRGRP